MIALKNDYDVECLDIVHVWASIGLKDQRKLIVGPPDNLMQPIDDFESVISDVVHRFKNNPSCTVVFGNDF